MESDFKEYPKTLAKDDFWGQVKRTVNGQPVPEEQIAMIVDAILHGLELSSSDTLLDLGCGNGALAYRLFRHLCAYYGVDYSAYLIAVAEENFARYPDFSFLVADVGDYLVHEPQPERFSKALCYGCFSYFDEDKARHVLASLRNRFTNVSQVFLGNLPDKARADKFFSHAPGLGELLDPESKIGIWRTKDEFSRLASEAGWELSFRQMPGAFYAAHYRYDVVLTRK